MAPGPGFDAPPEAYRDRDGRRCEAPGAPRLRFDTVADYRAGRSATLDPGAGSGLLDVLVCTAATFDRTGVLLLDGVPVAAGDGRYQLEVAPGRHRLDVQGADAASAAFDIGAGERVHFTTGQGVAVRHQVDYRTQLYRVRDAADLLPVLGGRAANASGAGCLLAVVGALALLTAVIASAVGAAAVAGPAGIAAFVLLGGGGLMGFLATRSLHKRAKGNRLAPERTEAGATAYPSPEDARGKVSGGPLLVFDLFLYRATRDPDGSIAYSGIGDTLALAHAGPLRTWIDDAEVPCDWAAWHYPLSAGPHRFRVDYAGEASTEFTLDVPGVGDAAVVHVPVRVFRVWDSASEAFEALPAEITHRITKRPKTAVGRTYQNNADPDDWVPPRIWPPSA
jgi:hypothetical protein